MPITLARTRRLRLPWLALVVAGVGVVAGACGSPSNPNALGGGSGEDASTGGSSGGGACATPATGCACSTAGQQIACGEVDTNEGSFVTCSEGTRTCSGGKWGACVGTVKVIKSTGSITTTGFHAYGNSLPEAGVGACSSNPCDPTCESFPTDTSNGVDAGGLTPTDAGGWTLPLSMGDGGTCSGLQCSVPTCSGGQTTTLTGIVLDPAGINPVYNAVVMIPNAGAAAVQPIAAGVSSDPCGGAPLPVATSFAYSGTNGTFTLTGVPVGASIPLVIQIGRWRRITTINTSSLTCGHSLNITPTTGGGATCEVANNYAGNANCPTRLPRIQSEGNIPLTAIATGGLDAMECMLYRMGVNSSQFTDELSGGRIHVFNDGGAVLGSPNVNHDLSYLMGFSCPGGNCPNSGVITNITNPGFDANNNSPPTGWTVVSGSNTTVYNNWVYTTSPNAVELGNFNGCGNYTNLDEIKQTGIVAPAGATNFAIDYYALCQDPGNAGSYSKVTLIDTTASTTQNCNIGCQWQAWQTCQLNATPGHNYTVELFNEDHPGSGYCSGTFYDSARWITNAAIPNLLPNYDLVVLPCDGGAEYSSGNWGYSNDDPGRTNLVNYANVGGRVFTSHWGREWIERTSAAIPNGPFPNVALWYGGGASGSYNDGLGVINSGTAWGAPFKAWMNAVGAAAGNTFTINPWREDSSSVVAANSELYVSYQGDGDPADFVFNTPVGSATPVGRVMFTDMHLANGATSGTFPGNCPAQGSALLQQEDAAEYLLFDLAGCVSGAPPPGNPQVYQSATFTRDFQGTCPSGQQVVWQNFYWADTTPGNSSVVFTAWTADSQAQLGTQYPAAPLTTANGANSCPNGPSCSNMPIGNGTNPGVAVDAALAAHGTPTTNMPPVASHSWLRVNMTLNPTSDQMTAPTLQGWQQTYGCVSSE
jgi:hypothetical protein